MKIGEIRISLFLGYFLLALFLTIIGLFVYVGAQKIGDDISEFHSASLIKNQLVFDFRKSQHLIQIAVQKHLYEKKVSEKKELEKFIDKEFDKNTRRMERLFRFSSDKKEIDLLNSLVQSRAYYQKERTKLLALSLKNSDSAFKFNIQSQLPAYLIFHAALDSLSMEVFDSVNSDAINTKHSIHSFSRIINGLILLALIGILLIGRMVWFSEKKLRLRNIELQKSEERFKELLNAVPDAIVGVNNDGNIVYANQNASILFGYSLNEFLGNKVEMLVPTKDQASHPSKRISYQHNPVNRKMGDTDYELFGRKKDDSEFPCEISLNSIDTDSGLLVLSTIRDITDRRAIEKALQQSEAFNKGVLSSLEAHIAVMDATGKIISINSAWSKAAIDNHRAVLERTPVGDNLINEYIIETSEGSEYAAQALSGIRSVFSKELVSYELAYPCFVDDKDCWFLLKVMNFESNEPMVVMSHVDITEIKKVSREIEKSERKFYDLFESMQDGVYKSTQSGRFVEVNTAMVSMLGYKSKEELLSVNIKSDLYFNESEREEAINQRLKSGSEVFRLKRKDGSEIWVEDKGKLVLDSSKNIVFHEGVLRDITERKRAEDLLDAKNIELEKTNAELDKFVYSTSHDLRSPLTSILGLIGFIEEDTKEPETLEHARMIKARIERLDSFITNILNYSRNNRLEVSPSKIDFNLLINQTIESLKHIEPSNKVRFNILVEEEFDFYSDQIRITTVLENLIGNALKYYSPEVENPIISIKVKTTFSNASIVIEDNGIGIADEHLGKVFDMFFRVSGSTPGSGLGLYLVSEIIVKLGGSIDVQSKLNSGTKFMITLLNFKKDELT
jgi:PAS domain S-box-containing protein